MTLPKYFKDFGKAVNDLLRPKSKDYELKQPTIEVQLKHDSPKTDITGKLEATDGRVNLELKDKVSVYKATTLTAKITSSKKPHLELENKGGLVDNLDIIVKGEIDKNLSVNAKFRRDVLAATTELVVDDFSGQRSDWSLKPSLVVGPFLDSRALIGASAVIKIGNGKQDPVDDFEVGAEWSRNDLTLLAKVVEKGTHLKLGLSYAPSKKTLFASEYLQPTNGGGEQKLALAGKYNFTPDTAVQTKVESSGQVSTVFSQQINKQVGLKLSSSFNASNLAKDTHKFGAKITLGDL